MEGYDWETLEQTVREIRDNTVTARSRATYQNSYCRFLAWIVRNKPHLTPPPFLESLGDTTEYTMQQLRACIKQHVTQDRSIAPLRFDAFVAADFVTWLVTLKRKDGGSLSYSALNTHWAGLFNLFRDYGHTMSKSLESELTNYFKGLKNKIAKSAANGESAVKTGKDPLMFDLYSFLCDKMMAHSSKEMAFAHAYMVIAWNLMCRSSNAFRIRYSHMEWRGDALQIYFAHMKNDQGGDRPRDPRHIYANPLQPSICPILALGLYWASSNFDGSDLLFPGSNQNERFRKCWLRLLREEDVAAELKRQGLDATELGTHSMRKGSATFCSSGSTACPSSTAVHLRAGWSLGGVQNTYLRYEAAGDMHVGRTVAGLPTESYKFSTLAPHFDCRDASVETGIKLMFPGLPERLGYIAEYCLASQVYHSSFLRGTLSPKHHLLETPIFQDDNLLSLLSTRVKIGDGCAEERLRPTSVPPHVAILCEMKWLKDGLLETLSKIEEARAGTVQDIMAELEKRAIGAGTVTYDGLHDAIRRCLQETGVADLVEKLTTTSAPDTNSTEEERESQPCHYWGGKFRRVPTEFDIPDCSVRHVWLLWLCGNKAKQVPPLRLLDGHDMPSRKLQKRLSQLRYVMRKIESCATSKGLLQRTLTIEEATQVFLDCADSVAVPDTTEQSRKRRRGQLS
ncbi:hypothetical protein PF003_g14132 [Phytophthora fragariae]|nr:hypothetical protein PF003_g14132 [Phytophthora fragariae]